MTLHYGLAARRNGDDTGTSPKDFRKDVEGLLVRAGAIYRGSALLVQGTGGWTFQLNAAWYATSRAAGDGLQLWGNDGAVTLSTNAAGTALPTAAPAAGLSRLYRVWVRHRSNSENTDSTSIPDAGVEFSAAATSPTLPALPTGATEIAQDLMTSAATTTASAGNTLTQTMPWTAARGGVVACRSVDEVNAVAALSTTSSPILAELAGALFLCRGTSATVSILGPELRTWTFDRTSSGVLGTTTGFTAGSYTTMATGTVTGAPAGAYLALGRIGLFNTVVSAASIRIRQGSTVVAESRADVEATVGRFFSISAPIIHAGGDLTVDLQASVASGSPTVHNAGSTAIVLVRIG